MNDTGLFAENSSNFWRKKQGRAATLYLPLDDARCRSTSPLYAPLYFIY
jgi:hypothetical protein